jgi:carbon storage regulator
MLVLTRKPGEQLVIGNNIRVTIVSVGPGRVKIGIEAPPDVRIDRQEIHEKILHEQEQAADVLSVVTGTHASGQSPTMIGSGSGDTMQLHNRLTERPVPAATTDLTVTPAPVAVNRVKHRLPRKPR